MDRLTSTLRGRWTGIRPPTGADVVWVQERIIVGAFGPRTRFGATVPGVDELAYALTSNAVSTMIIHRADSPDPLGLVQLFDYDDVRQNGRVAVALEQPMWAKAWPLEGVMLFFHHLFQAIPLRKLYVEATADSLDHYGSAVGTVFAHEATLREHQWSEGRLEDVHVLSLSAEAWAEHRPFVEQLLTSEPVG